MSRFRLSAWWHIALLLAVAGCHREVPEDIPSADTRKITIADRFYDVVALNAQKALVCGYAGKILMTEDGGYTWQLISSGTDKALYAMHFADATRGLRKKRVGAEHVIGQKLPGGS